MLDIKFGTVRPVSFREYDESYRYTDLNLVAKFAGIVHVSDYDKERYKDDEEVSKAVKSGAVDMMQTALDGMPAGGSILKSDKSELCGLISADLKKAGITAASEIMHYTLSPESREIFDNMMEVEKVAAQLAPDGIWPEEEGDIRQPGTYRINYMNPEADCGFCSEKRYYLPGEDVEVIYKGLFRDARYFFFADAEGYNVRCEGSVAKITFVMPDHDVDVLFICDTERFRDPNIPYYFLG